MREQAEHVKLGLRADVHLPVEYGWQGKLDIQASGRTRAGVQVLLVLGIGCGRGRQNRRRVLAAAPCCSPYDSRHRSVAADRDVKTKLLTRKLCDELLIYNSKPTRPVENPVVNPVVVVSRSSMDRLES